MPLKLDFQKTFCGKSDRVKCVDFHPKEPWILAALYTGIVLIWNCETQTIVRTFEVSELPMRTAKFIPRKNWIVCGGDDLHLRIFNYNTCEKVHDVEAHSDYMRTIVVHPTLPYILSGSDDMSIKLWDWTNQLENKMDFEGHTHYVMQIEINPKDTNSFASASLDRTIKIWGINSNVPHFQLEGHDLGVNCINYYQGGDRPLLISGGDDFIVKIWDYQTKTCIASLEAHTANVTAAIFHPHLPIILAAYEDGAIKVFHSHTHRLETTLHFGMERAWSLAAMPSSNKVAVGFDDGTLLIRVGQEEPVVSMDPSGKIIWARNHEIQFVNVLRLGKKNIVDGEILPVAPDDLGSVEFYPHIVQHNKNGQLVTVCGDDEYTIYTALKLKNKTFGQALDFVWSDSKDVYATRESSTKIKIFHEFKEFKTIRASTQASMIFGGHLLGVRSDDCIDFYDWNDGRIVRRIEISPKQVYWSETGNLVALVCDDVYYVLLYNEEYVVKCLSNPSIEVDEQGYENAFELISDANDSIASAQFSGDIFIYTNNNCRLNYAVGGQIITLAHLDKLYYVLGYLQRENRIYLIDKRYNIISYELLRIVLAYQTAIVRGDLENANMLLSSGKIPKDYYNRLAQFLEKQGKKELALQLSQDIEHQFELALQLKKLDLAKEFLQKSPSAEKWKQLGDAALTECDFKTAEECALNGEDLSLLLLLYSSTNNRKGLYKLSQLAIKQSRYDVAFNVLFMLGRADECIELLNKTERFPEAAFMARSFYPQRVDDLQNKWKEALMSISPAAANSLGNTTTHPSHFLMKQNNVIKQSEKISIIDEDKNDTFIDTDTNDIHETAHKTNENQKINIDMNIQTAASNDNNKIISDTNIDIANDRVKINDDDNIDFNFDFNENTISVENDNVKKEELKENTTTTAATTAKSPITVTATVAVDNKNQYEQEDDMSLPSDIENGDNADDNNDNNNNNNTNDFDEIDFDMDD